MNFLKKLYSLIISMKTMVILTLIFAISCAVATFIENDFGTETAWAVVYKAKWFEILQVLLGINLLGNIFRFKLYQKKKLPAFIFHSGFLVILLGAGITRYIGYEGIMHIREGETTNKMISSEPYVQITAKKGDKIYHAEMEKLISQISSNNFKLVLNMGDDKAIVRYKKYISHAKPENPSKKQIVAIVVDLEYKGKHKEVILPGGGRGVQGVPKKVEMGGAKFILEWGSKDIYLPFSIKLRDFQLERYPGSMAPSSYASEVTVIDKKDNVKMDYRIYMNHVLDYKGFRFFQSSYDMDELGTVLSVNHDPGTLITYIGYFMLAFGLLLNLFNPYSRFRKLTSEISNDINFKNVFVFLGILFMFNAHSLKAEDSLKNIEIIKKISPTHAEKFGHLLIQANMGRVEPVDTLAHDILHKIARKNNIYNLSADQIILSMLVKPKLWQNIPIIYLPRSDKKLKKILGIPLDKKYASFSDFFDYSNKNPYKLQQYVEKASRKRSADRNQFDKDVIKVDERVNVVYMTFMGDLFRLFPKPNDPSLKWYSPKDAISTFPPKLSNMLREILLNYFDSVNEGIKSGNFDKANKALNLISTYQKRVGKDLIPSDTKIDLEILYNKYDIFSQAMKIYLIAGFILLIIVFLKILKRDFNVKWLAKGAFYLIIFSFAIHTIGLILRWYLAEHAPWSNAYESMLYIAWTMALAGVVFSRKSLLALTLMSILAGITLFVAHLGGMDPQITNLVPVLKSYWLNIHVAVITSSYGFLGLSALLGFFTLILLILRNPNNKERSENIEKSVIEATKINEVSMILGLSLLTVGNFLGGVWANESWGRYWGWDPKETWAWISILIYTVVLHMRFIPKLNFIYTFAVASTLAYFSIIMTYFGVNYYLSGMHSYAAGDPVPIPSFVYYMIGAIFLVIALSYPKRLNKKL